MSSDFSLIGYESIPVAEYMPILQKIMDDLKIIYDSRVRTQRNLNTDILNNSIMHPPCIDKRVLDSTDAISATPETATKSIQNIQNCQTNWSVNFSNPFQTDNGNSNVEENITIENNLRSELQNLKEELSAKTDETEQMKDELTRNNGKIESLKAKYKKIKDTLNEKEDKLKSLINTIKNQTDEINQKDESFRNLQEEMNRIQLETSTLRMNENKKENPRMQQVIEDKNKRISDLESTISKLEAKQIENNENKERITELENKIMMLENKHDDEVDLNYATLLSKLKKKREEMREKDHKINDIETELEESRMKYLRSEKINKTLTSNLKSLKQEYEECEKLKDEYLENFKMISKENRKMKKESISENEMVKYKNELKDYKEQLKQKDNQLKHKENLVTELQNKNENLLNANQNSKGKLDELDKYKLEIDRKNKLLEENVKRIADLTEDCSKKQQAMVVMREKIRGKSESDPQDVKKLNFQMKAMEAELDQAHDKITNMNAAYDEKAKECDLSAKEIQTLQLENANLKQLFNHKDQDRMTREPTPSRQRSEVNEFPSWWKNHQTAK